MKVNYYYQVTDNHMAAVDMQFSQCHDSTVTWIRR